MKRTSLSSLLFIPVLALPLLSACGLKTRDVKPDFLDKVRSAAVVSFSVDQPASNEISLDAGSGKVSGVAGGGSLINEESTDVEHMHGALSEAFARKMGWKMITPAQLKTSPAYSSFFSDKMKGWQMKMPAGQGTTRLLANGIADSYSLLRTKPADRDRLMTGLGVDAIIEGNVQGHFEGTTVMGIGPRKPRANLSFWVYAKGHDEPIWFEGQVKGSPSQESVGKTGFFSEKAVTKLARASAQTAFNLISPTPVKK